MRRTAHFEQRPDVARAEKQADLSLAFADADLRRARSTSENALDGATTWAAADTQPGASPIDAQDVLASGTLLAGTYRVDQLLARGGMGAVYLGRNLRLACPVAIKVLLSRRGAEPRIARLFTDESRAIARVRHANVVQVFATGRHDNLPFVVMEYVPGITVATFIHQARCHGQPTSLDTICEIVGQASRGLTAIHASGLYHGDVKPSNMLITSGFRLAISDFDLVGSSCGATVPDRGLSRPRPPSGTPIYIAPEMLRGMQVRPDERSLCDVYSLGVSAFELLTNRPPFEGPSIRAILEGHLFAPAPRLSTLRPDLPPRIDAIMARVLAKDPRQRFQGCTPFAVELSQLCDAAGGSFSDRAVPPRGPVGAPSLRRAAPRRRETP
jgi:serine/threonine protein kinase